MEWMSIQPNYQISFREYLIIIIILCIVALLFSFIMYAIKIQELKQLCKDEGYDDLRDLLITEDTQMIECVSYIPYTSKILNITSVNDSVNKWGQIEKSDHYIIKK